MNKIILVLAVALAILGILIILRVFRQDNEMVTVFKDGLWDEAFERSMNDGDHRL